MTIVGPLKQLLSHQEVNAYFYEVAVAEPKTEKFICVKRSEVDQVATPRIVSTYIEKYYNNITE